MMIEVYLIKCRKTGDGYVGSGADATGRWDHHRQMLRKGEHCNPNLQRAWDRFGATAFSMEIVDYCSDTRRAALEQEWIEEYGTYNLQPALKGCEFAPSTREKMSAAAKKRYAEGRNGGLLRGGNTVVRSEKRLAALANGRSKRREMEINGVCSHHSEETKSKIAAALRTPKNRRKTSLRFKGKKQSAEQVRKRMASKKRTLAAKKDTLHV